MLELDLIADRLIGSDAEGGLSLEQRKRTTLGVELAANPSVIFLDEPTSGLDARSAQVYIPSTHYSSPNAAKGNCARCAGRIVDVGALVTSAMFLSKVPCSAVGVHSRLFFIMSSSSWSTRWAKPFRRVRANASRRSFNAMTQCQEESPSSATSHTSRSFSRPFFYSPNVQSSQVVMRAIRKVAATQRAVICTIHQPSTYLFEMFDALLLLKKGGQPVFFGQLGENSSKLIAYLQVGYSVFMSC